MSCPLGEDCPCIVSDGHILDIHKDIIHEEWTKYICSSKICLHGVLIPRYIMFCKWRFRSIYNRDVQDIIYMMCNKKHYRCAFGLIKMYHSDKIILYDFIARTIYYGIEFGNSCKVIEDFWTVFDDNIGKTLLYEDTYILRTSMTFLFDARDTHNKEHMDTWYKNLNEFVFIYFRLYGNDFEQYNKKINNLMKSFPQGWQKILEISKNKNIEHDLLETILNIYYDNHWLLFIDIGTFPDVEQTQYVPQYLVVEGPLCEDAICLICYYIADSRKHSVMIGCRHVFHKKCLEKWLKISRICPMCRRDVE